MEEMVIILYFILYPHFHLLNSSDSGVTATQNKRREKE